MKSPALRVPAKSPTGLFLGDKTIHHPELALPAAAQVEDSLMQRFPKGRWTQAPTAATPEQSFFWSALNEY